MSSTQFGTVTNLNQQATSSTFLSSVTKFRMNAKRRGFMGLTNGMSGHAAFVPTPFFMVALIFSCYFFSPISNSKLVWDEQARTIDKRHGWEQFKDYSLADQARVLGYIRSEQRLGGYVHTARTTTVFDAFIVSFYQNYYSISHITFFLPTERSSSPCVSRPTSERPWSETRPSSSKSAVLRREGGEREGGDEWGGVCVQGSLLASIQDV